MTQARRNALDAIGFSWTVRPIRKPIYEQELELIEKERAQLEEQRKQRDESIQYERLLLEQQRQQQQQRHQQQQQQGHLQKTAV